MNIKSLLLGSAAALIAVSGARAADAVVVADPEPTQYVKVCDVYGAGYFYIPGTDTCLRIGGYVRLDVGGGDAGSFDGVNHVPDQMGNGTNSTYWNQLRFTLKTWTGQETELGTLKTYTETRMNWGNSYGDYSDQDAANANNWSGRNTGITLNFAYIQLGGLRVGKDESAFDTFIGYAGNVINDTIIPYGGFDTNVIQYYFDAGNGLTFMGSLETGSGIAGDVDTELGHTFNTNSGNDSIDSYTPDVVIGGKYTQGWGAITAVGAYDSTWEEWAGKVRLDVNATSDLTLFIMGGYGTDDNIDRNFYKQWGGNWAVWGGGTYKFNEKTSANLQVSADDDKDYAIAANIAYDVVPGFTITGEVDYNHDGMFGDTANDRNWVGANKENSVGGILRFQRSF